VKTAFQLDKKALGKGARFIKPSLVGQLLLKRFIGRLRNGPSTKRRLLIGAIFVVLLILVVVTTALSSLGIGTGWASDAVTFQLVTKMVFPKGSVAVLDRGSFDLYENDNLLGNVKVITFAPSAGQTLLVTTTVQLPYSNILTLIESYLTHAGIVVWRIAGDATFNTVVGQVDLPTDITTIPSVLDFYSTFLLVVLIMYVGLAVVAYRKKYL